MARNKFDVDEALESTFNKGMLIRLMEYIKPYKTQLGITFLIMLVASFATLLGPYLVMVAMDDKIVNKDIKGLVFLSVIFIITLIVNGICVKYKTRIMSFVGQDIVFNIRQDLFAHLQKLPFAYYDSRPHGKILVRVVNYVNSLSDLLSNGIINLATDLFSLFVILGFMLFIDVRLTLISMVGLPILAIIVFAIKGGQRRAWQRYSNKNSNLTAYIHESICGIKVTQSFAREDENMSIFDEQCQQNKANWMKAKMIETVLNPSVDTISVLTTSLLYIGGLFWLGGSVTIGVLIAFIGYSQRFWQPIMTITNFYNAIITNMAYLERIFEVMDEVPLVTDSKDATIMPDIKGDVEFKNVNFSYEDGHTILEDVSFKVKSGESIALVGPTGAGKSTIVNLISRFYNLNTGEILIDGVDISKVKLNSLRKQMGIMLQDTFIFSGNIMDNIRYGRLDARDEEVIEAARAVCAHKFISELEDGYYTEVNERGTRLSVGQRQLISFARALLANPKILILDEATSSIDTETEIALQKGLDRLLQGRTSFVIAHRLSTIKNSSRIMYVSEKNIAESGTHDELIESKGLYYNLYTSQFSFIESI